MNGRISVALIAAVALAVASFAAQAIDPEPYPRKPIKLIVPTVPGPPPDVVARILAEKLGGALGQPVVVENRPGAIGTIGLNAVVKAAPDGYTLGLIALPYVVAPSLLAQVPYDTEKDLAPVTLTNWNHPILAVRADSPVRSVADLVPLAKARPGELKYASSGNGTPPHLAGELFKREAGVTITHIPYKGPSPAVIALLVGEVDLTILATSVLSPHLKSGKLRALATVAPRRLAKYPDIPTLVELGYPELGITDWQGIVVPAGTPGDVIARLHAEIVKVLAVADFRQRLEVLGLEAAGLGPERFAAHMHKEIQRWSKLVRDTGIKAD
jgi:tripartite-type tricarboxylate transporter receptor subunit TctC